MKCTTCGRNFKRKQMTAESYDRILNRKQTSRLGKSIAVIRECDACAKLHK